jgi:hypothetical protein
MHDLFVASAGVAGALIGLLFVALTIAYDRVTGDDPDHVHRLRATAALTAFTNALSVSLFGLLPGVELGGTALVVGVFGLIFVTASLLSLRRVQHGRVGIPRDALFLVSLFVVFAFQLFFAAELISRPARAGAARGVGVLVIVCFLIGIGRAWELVGGPSIGIAFELGALRRSGSGDEPLPVEHERDDPPPADVDEQ